MTDRCDFGVCENRRAQRATPNGGGWIHLSHRFPEEWPRSL
jgi:hypothetical protein